MMDQWSDELLIALGRVTAASAELDGDVAFLSAILGTKTSDWAGDKIAAWDLADWRAGLMRGTPTSHLRKRAERVLSPGLRRQLLQLCDEVQAAQADRDRHVHSIGSADRRWHPRSDEHFDTPTPDDLDRLATRLVALAGEASKFAAQIPADSLRTDRPQS